MVFADESTVSIGGVVLPGTIKSIEIKGEATIDEQSVEGKTTKPKQVTGYEDVKITLELILEDSPNMTADAKHKKLLNMFRRPGQAKPYPYAIVNKHTAAYHVTVVILKNISSKQQAGISKISVTIELWEYKAMQITATKKKTSKKKSSSNSTSGLSSDYANYLKNSRGTAPKDTSKTSKSSVKDNADGSKYKSRLSGLK